MCMRGGIEESEAGVSNACVCRHKLQRWKVLEGRLERK